MTHKQIHKTETPKRDLLANAKKQLGIAFLLTSLVVGSVLVSYPSVSNYINNLNAQAGIRVVTTEPCTSDCGALPEDPCTSDCGALPEDPVAPPNPVTQPAPVPAEPPEVSTRPIPVTPSEPTKFTKLKIEKTCVTETDGRACNTGAAINKNENVKYTLTVTNFGDLESTQVSVYDDYDQSKINLLKISRGIVINDGDVLSFSFGIIPAFTAKTAVYIANVTAWGPGNVVNTAGTLADRDATTGDDEVSTTFPLALQTNVSIAKNCVVPSEANRACNAAPVLVGKEVQYTLSIKNDGPGTALNTTVIDSFVPTHLSILNTQNGGVIAANKINFSIGNIGVGEIKTLTYTAKVLAKGGSTVTNIATVFADNDSNDGDNKTQYQFTVVAPIVVTPVPTEVPTIFPPTVTPVVTVTPTTPVVTVTPVITPTPTTVITPIVTTPPGTPKVVIEHRCYIGKTQPATDGSSFGTNYKPDCGDAKPSDTVWYAVTVTNTGTAVATNVTVDLPVVNPQLIEGQTFVNPEGVLSNYSFVVPTLGINNAIQKIYRSTVKASVPLLPLTNIISTAKVVYSNPGLGNNSVDTAVFHIKQEIPTKAIALEKFCYLIKTTTPCNDPASKLKAGSDVTYIFRVTNPSKSDVEAISLTDVYDQKVSAISTITDGGVWDKTNGLVSWTKLGIIKAGTNKEFSMDSKLGDKVVAGSIIANTATLTGTEVPNQVATYSFTIPTVITTPTVVVAPPVQRTGAADVFLLTIFALTLGAGAYFFLNNGKVGVAFGGSKGEF
jgi:uncharacterized repeat protein (TIGR01451 family)